jgi:hypothetical protein
VDVSEAATRNGESGWRLKAKKQVDAEALRLWEPFKCILEHWHEHHLLHRLLNEAEAEVTADPHTPDSHRMWAVSI